MSLVVSITLSFNHALRMNMIRAMHRMMLKLFIVKHCFIRGLTGFGLVWTQHYMNFLESSPRGFFARSNPSFARLRRLKILPDTIWPVRLFIRFFFFNFSIAIHRRISIVVEKLGWRLVAHKTNVVEKCFLFISLLVVEYFSLFFHKRTWKKLN